MSVENIFADLLYSNVYVSTWAWYSREGQTLQKNYIMRQWTDQRYKYDKNHFTWFLFTMKGRWIHSGRGLLTDGDIVFRDPTRITLSSSDYSLKIANLKKADHGNYTCKDDGTEIKRYSLVAKGDFFLMILLLLFFS